MAAISDLDGDGRDDLLIPAAARNLDATAPAGFELLRGQQGPDVSSGLFEVADPVLSDRSRLQLLATRDLFEVEADRLLFHWEAQGQLALAYKVYRCWPSEYQALPELDASASAVAIQTLKLENEGWERDYDVGEPTEPSFTEPE